MGAPRVCIPFVIVLAANRGMAQVTTSETCSRAVADQVLSSGQLQELQLHACVDTARSRKCGRQGCSGTHVPEGEPAHRHRCR
jgi:hypothetical protein